jgi:hypothetical protein
MMIMMMTIMIMVIMIMMTMMIMKMDDDSKLAARARPNLPMRLYLSHL